MIIRLTDPKRFSRGLRIEEICLRLLSLYWLGQISGRRCSLRRAFCFALLKPFIYLGVHVLSHNSLWRQPVVPMKQTILKLAVLSLLIGASLTILINRSAARGAREQNSNLPSSAATQEKTVEQVQKNIKVLTGMPQSQLIPVMNFFAASMGRRCNFCHVNKNGQWDYVSDEKPEKNTAREMIKMVLEVNKTTFKGSVEVSCYTCHRGRNQPQSIPLLPLPLASPPPANPALAGPVGWEKSARGVRELTGGELAQVRAANNLFSLIKLKEQFTRTRVSGQDKIGDREVYVVNGTITDDKRQRLYFDVETGLLLRRITFTQTMIGVIPEEVDFEDYRDVDGIRFPFVARSSTIEVGNPISTRQFTDIKLNAAVDESKFKMPPAPKPATP